MKEVEWWEYKVPSDSCWYWKKVVEVKDMIKNKTDLNSFMNIKYTVQQGYRLLFDEQSTNFTWSRSVWCRLSIPKHKIIMWLAILGN